MLKIERENIVEKIKDGIDAEDLIIKKIKYVDNTEGECVDKKISYKRKYQKDADIMLAALKSNRENLKHVDESLFKNKKFVLEAVKICPNILARLKEPLRSDWDINFNAITYDPKMIEVSPYIDSEEFLYEVSLVFNSIWKIRDKYKKKLIKKELIQKREEIVERTRRIEELEVQEKELLEKYRNNNFHFTAFEQYEFETLYQSLLFEVNSRNKLIISTAVLEKELLVIKKEKKKEKKKKKELKK